jgi:AcrR family transcriptional regulator
MPRTPEQNEKIRNEKKQAILDVAMKLFAEKGYAATSTNEIVKEANISKGLLYNYFESKEDILKTIILSFGSEVFDMIDPSRNNILNKKEMSLFFDKYFELLMARPEEVKLYMQLSVQPEAGKILAEISPEIMKQEYHVLSYFSEDKNSNILLVDFTVIINGLMLVYAFSPERFSDETMLNYKNFLKNMFIGRGH